MSEASGGGTPDPFAPPAGEPKVTGWTAWVFLGATLLVVVGVLHAIQGLVAIFTDSYFLVVEDRLLVRGTATAWGWGHLLIGVLTVAAGLALFVGRMWARVVGMALATVSALVHLASIAASPVWSAIVILLDVVIVYAIAVHGREVRAAAARKVP
jgi:hypothetical protein